eukprot:7151276-Prymnesium_polylepis.1
MRGGSTCRARIAREPSDSEYLVGAPHFWHGKCATPQPHGVHTTRVHTFVPPVRYRSGASTPHAHTRSNAAPAHVSLRLVRSVHSPGTHLQVVKLCASRGRGTRTRRAHEARAELRGRRGCAKGFRQQGSQSWNLERRCWLGACARVNDEARRTAAAKATRAAIYRRRRAKQGARCVRESRA